MRSLFSNPKRTLIVTIVLALLIIGYFTIMSNRNPSIYPDEVKLDYDKLYDDARKSKKKGDLDRAQETLQKIVLSDPGYKDAAKRLKDLTRENLYKKTKDALARNQLQAARDYLDMLNNIDPNYKDTAQLRDDISKGTPPANNPNDPGPPGTGSNKTPPDVEPINLLPDKIDGFNLLQRQWLKSGVEANAAYRHDVDTNKADWDITDMVVITATKYPNVNETKARFLTDKDAFPTDSEIVSINDHEAYFGLYAEKLFVLPGALIWTQDKWLFSVMVLPKPASKIRPEMTRETTLRIAKDVAGKFGY